MDVNATLTNIRHFTAEVFRTSAALDALSESGAATHGGTSLADWQAYHDSAASMLAGAVQDLDEWLGKGGFLPADWQKAREIAEISSALDSNPWDRA